MKRRLATALVCLFARISSAETWSVTASLKDGSAIKGTTQLSAFTLVTSVGTLDIRMEQLESITMDGEKAVVRIRDGSSFSGTLDPATWRLATSVGLVDVAMSKLKTLSVEGRATPEVPKVPVETPPNPPLGMPVDLPAELKPERVDLGGIFRGPIEVLNGGQTVLLLDASSSRLVAVNAGTLAIKGAAPVTVTPFATATAAEAPCWSLSPSGKRAFVACRKTVSVVDVEAMKTLKTFPLEKDLREIVALSDDSFIGLTPESTVLISVSAQAITETFEGGRGTLVATRDRGRVYSDAATWDFLTEGETAKVSRRRWTDRILTATTVSEDGRWALNLEGDIFRLGQGSLCEFARAGTVPKSFSAAFLPGSKSMVHMTRDGKLEVRNTGTFDLVKSVPTPKAFGHLAAAAPAGRAVWVIFSPISMPPSTPNLMGASGFGGPGKLYRITIPE